MKNNISFLLVLSFFCACNSSSDLVTKDTIASAEGLFDIEYTDAERDSMVNYLERNLEGYVDMHAYTLPNKVPMSLYFDPHPMGYILPNDKQQENIWEIDLDIKRPENIHEIAFYDIPKLAGLIQTKQITSVEMTRFFIDRINKYDDTLKCVITLTEELALRQAEKADQLIKEGTILGPLHGVPYGIKDLFAVKSYPTTWGAAPYKDQMIDQDATVVQKLASAGAVLIAKLTSGALASGDVWFDGQTLNPWNMNQGASGSSAGSGSATSAGLVPFAIGTETLGSITSPSSRCGITGLRPTFGRVSRAGCMTLSWSMDKAGPMARTAYDCAIILDAINGLDPHDRATRGVSFNYDTGKDLKDLKIAFLKEGFDEQDFRENDSLSLSVFDELGLKMDEVSFPEDIPYKGLQIIIRAESGALFEELTRTNEDDLMRRQGRRHRPTTLRQSHLIPATQYIQANRYRDRLIHKMDEIFSKYDLVIVPSRGFNQLLITNLTGHPAISVPNGFHEESPTSFTVLGGLYKEAEMLQLIKAYQEATGYDEMHPEYFLD